MKLSSVAILFQQSADLIHSVEVDHSFFQFFLFLPVFSLNV